MERLVGTYVAFSELGSGPPSEDLLRKLLEPYSLGSVLELISWVCLRCRAWSLERSNDPDKEIAQQYLSNFKALKAIWASEPDRVLFSRIGLLVLAKATCSICSPEGKKVQSQSDVVDVLISVLIAQELLVKDPTPNGDHMRDAALILPFSSAMPKSDPSLEVIRSVLFVEDFSPKHRADARFKDLDRLFEEATGVASVRLYCQLVLAACTRFMRSNNEESWANGVRLATTHFDRSQVPKDDARRVLDHMSRTFAQLKEEPRGRLINSDFAEFEAYPLVQVDPGQYICIDPMLMLNKAGRGIFWTIRSVSDIQLIAYWGLLFEDYVLWLLLEHSAIGHSKIVCSPRFRDGTPVCDFCINEGFQLILIEAKASIMARDVKHSGSGSKLKEHLDKKIVHGDEGERKGVAQLAHSCERIRSGEDIVGLDRDQVTKLYPCVLLLDHSFNSLGLKKYYEREFKSQVRRNSASLVVTPLYALSIEDLEVGLAYTDQASLSAILDCYYSNSQMRAMVEPLEYAHIRTIAKPIAASTRLSNVVDELLVDGKNRFFGESL